ncbi:MAG: C39 family peptidase [Candidatus Levybacteria bacterium]|nr:C39 family peptidase [Candidatus Levybacteria bacterium]
MRNWKIIISGIVLLSIYIVFWVWFFTPTGKSIPNNIHQLTQKIFNKKDVSALGAQTSESTFPENYKIPIDSRKQFFNLSCEFSAASGIVFHFTKNPDFSPANGKLAEEKLINKTWISRNPNVGIRMGEESITNLDILYENLNKGFGGSDYYGVHAPPFIDLFSNYKLTAKPIYINESTITSIKKAISKGHLIMAWIKIGYAKSVDDYLSYGAVKIIRGEHVIVINGYDQKGVIAMDPGIGLERHIEYGSLIDASYDFPIPFLEVYEDLDNKSPFDNLTIGLDTLTGIDRSIPKILVNNGSGQTGAATQMWEILRDFGYNMTAVNNADNFDYQDITIKTKKNFSDYSYILSRDIKLADYMIASSSSDLSEESEADMVVIVGK